MQPLRFLVSVDRQWQVKVSCPALGLDGPSRMMRGLPNANGGVFPLAPEAELPKQLPEAERHACCRLYCCTDDAAVLMEGRRRIIDRDPDPQYGTSPFGGYLFHALIGADTWRWVRRVAADNRAQCIELALSWSNRDANLNRLNWEMMHDGHGFLAAGLPGRNCRHHAACCRDQGRSVGGPAVRVPAADPVRGRDDAERSEHQTRCRVPRPIAAAAGERAADQGARAGEDPAR